MTIDTRHTRTKNYVVGFVFCGDEVLLIRKARPTWQAGRLNGVGGHIEAGETPEQAMVREFEEETGWRIEGWEHFVTLTGDDSDADRQAAGGTKFGVWFFSTQVVPEQIPAVNIVTDEPTAWFKVTALPDEVLPNLRWLVPLAYHAHRYDWPLLVTERTPVPASPLDLDALEAAFIVYWKDFGNARHNLTAAIREYLRVVDPVASA
jgi:8-oxo-dGTP diphosphatase